MKWKQWSILFGIITGFITVDFTIMRICSIPDRLPIGFIILVTECGGYAVGMLQEKWKRDKEMSQIVAERLLRKPEIASEPQMNTDGLAQAWTNRNAQMNTYLSSLLGSPASSHGIAGKSQGNVP